MEKIFLAAPAKRKKLLSVVEISKFLGSQYIIQNEYENYFIYWTRTHQKITEQKLNDVH